MSSNAQAPRPTINGNNANVDSMLAKLNARLSDLSVNLGVVRTPQPAQQVGSVNQPIPVSSVLNSTQTHIDALQTAHSFMDDIESTLGPQKS